MDQFIIYSNLLTGFLLLAVAFILRTENLVSSLFFKVLPFFLGGALVFNGLKLLHLI